MVLAHHPGAMLNMRQLRAEVGLSREKMGRLISVSTRTIENWEREDRLPLDEPRRARLAAVAEIRELGLAVYTPARLHRF